MPLQVEGIVHRLAMIRALDRCRRYGRARGYRHARRKKRKRHCQQQPDEHRNHAN
jgi:hypothetical protein